MFQAPVLCRTEPGSTSKIDSGRSEFWSAVTTSGLTDRSIQRITFDDQRS